MNLHLHIYTIILGEAKGCTLHLGVSWVSLRVGVNGKYAKVGLEALGSRRSVLDSQLCHVLAM